MMGIDTPETFRGWRNILRISCASSWFFITRLYRGADKSLARTGFRSTRVGFSVDFYEYWYWTHGSHISSAFPEHLTGRFNRNWRAGNELTNYGRANDLSAHRGDVVGWDTALQGGRSRARIPLVTSGFFIDMILPALGSTSLQQKWVPGILPWG
jgi:hypothetical protein